MFFYSISTKAIDAIAIETQCGECGNPDIYIFNYIRIIYVYFIPFIPIKKYRNITCLNCKTQFHISEFNYKLMDVPKTKAPWWCYLGLLIILALWGSGLIFNHLPK